MEDKKQIIQDLFRLSDELEKKADALKDMQIKFLSDGLKVVLHAGQNMEFARIFSKHILGYLKECDSINKKRTTFNGGLNDEDSVMLN